MRRFITTAVLATPLLALSIGLLSSCNETNAQTRTDSFKNVDSSPSRSMRAGTVIPVALASNLSSESAQVGDVWHGTVTENVAGQNGGLIPSGSDVSGTVASVTPAKRGSRAMLQLGLTSVRIEGHDEAIAASSESVIAGSTRARNLGAIAGGVAAGALIGNAVGDGKNATVGGLIGGAAATGVVATSKGYQVVLKDGVVMTFTVDQTVALR